MANKQNTSTGVEKIKAAAKNPANSKLFDAFITGALDESVVDKSYMNTDIEFSTEEVENVCKLLTRERIGAYQNDTNRSASELLEKYLDVVVDGDHANDKIIDANMSIMTDVLNSIDPDHNLDDETALQISAAALFRNIFMVVLGTPAVIKEDVSTAANESVKVEEPKAEETVVVVEPNKELSDVNLKELQMAFEDMKSGKLSKTDFYQLVKNLISDERILEQMLDIISGFKTIEEPKAVEKVVEKIEEKPKEELKAQEPSKEDKSEPKKDSVEEEFTGVFKILHDIAHTDKYAKK